MKIIKIISIVFILTTIAVAVILKVFIYNVLPGEVGVMTNNYDFIVDKGVVKKDFKPGWHLSIPGFNSWISFDSTVQVLEMTKNPSRGDRKGRDDVQVQSADGYTVSVDVTVKYRIKDNSAHLVLQDTGTGTKYKTVVRNEAEQSCLAEFGKMKTEDFYNPDQKREKATLVKSRLSKELDDNFIEVVDVLIRDVQFDPDYEKKIQQKKLADQDVEVNKSEEKKLEMQGKREVTEAETLQMLNVIKREKEAELIRMEAEANREIAKIVADYNKYVTEKQADADLISAQLKAKGELLVKKAEAEGEKLRNAAMMGVGGSTIVALEAAKNLNLSNITISTVDTDLLDLDEMATKLGVQDEK